MNIVNGSLDRRNAVLVACNLHSNPFIKAEPKEDLIDSVFVGRESELRDAAWRIYDGPRNLLVVGGYGHGKTTFVRKLLRELRMAQRVRFLTGYATLQQSSPEGLRLAALTALVEGALKTAAQGTDLHSFALETAEQLSRIDTESQVLRLSDLRFRRGLELAQAAGIHRVVIAIDELDKRAPLVVHNILMGARALLDTDASFVLTGRYMDVFADVRASLLAAFDHWLELRLLDPDELREILRRNLAAVRQHPEPQASFAPFDEEVVNGLIEQSRGLPRPLNLTAYAALEELLQTQEPLGEATPRVTGAHLARALQRQGSLVFGKLTKTDRALVVKAFKYRSYVSGAALTELDPELSLSGIVQVLEQLSREDAFLRQESVTGPAFELAPTVEYILRALQQRRERQRALWEALQTEEDSDGRRLEEFAADLFAEGFKVAERNARTATEEFDLILQPSHDTDPAFRRSLYLIVECKSWRSQKVDQREVTWLAGIMLNRRLKQGFLLTTGSFTSGAIQQARNFMAQDLEILLIDGEQMRSFLSDLKLLNDLLADLHRAQVLHLRQSSVPLMSTTAAQELSALDGRVL